MMNGYVGDYGEEFLGIGYSPAANGTGLPGIESHPSSVDRDSDTNHYQYNESQPLFVPAQIIEKNAEIARSKAKDILNNILHGIDSAKDSKAPQNSRYPNQDKTGAVDTISGNKNSTKIPQSQTHSNSSIESEAQAARTKALGILRKFQYHPDEKINTIESEAQAARAKAMGILRKFQSQTNENDNHDSLDATIDEQATTQPINPSSVAPLCPSQETYSTAGSTHGVHVNPEQYQPPHDVSSQHTTISSITHKATTPPWELAKRRRACLEKENERKQHALFKNLQFVARLEEERLAKQLVEFQQVKTLEQQIDERYQQKMEYRIKKRNNMNDGSNNINTSGAGIGTKQRRKAEAKRRKTALPPSLRQKHRGNRGDSSYSAGGNNGSNSVAIYISNLPTDGSIDEGMVRSLFSAYGNLRKIHFYLDKITGRKKGDALVIYSLTEGEDEIGLTESVCSQVGAYWYIGRSIAIDFELR